MDRQNSATPKPKGPGSSRSFTALRKDAGLCCGSRLRKVEVFAYVGLPQNLKDLKNSEPYAFSSALLQGCLAHKKVCVPYRNTALIRNSVWQVDLYGFGIMLWQMYTGR